MALTDECVNRLYNWKFEQAQRYLTDEATDHERHTVDALVRLFGNPGWGIGGDLGVLVRATVRDLIGDVDD